MLYRVWLIVWIMVNDCVMLFIVIVSVLFGLVGWFVI